MTPTDNEPLFRNRGAAQAARLEERARAMRASLTPSEALLWAQLRGRRLGVVFRRQAPLLGRYTPTHRLQAALASVFFVKPLEVGPQRRGYCRDCSLHLVVVLMCSIKM